MMGSYFILFYFTISYFIYCCLILAIPWCVNGDSCVVFWSRASIYGNTYHDCEVWLIIFEWHCVLLRNNDDQLLAKRLFWRSKVHFIWLPLSFSAGNGSTVKQWLMKLCVNFVKAVMSNATFLSFIFFPFFGILSSWIQVKKIWCYDVIKILTPVFF